MAGCIFDRGNGTYALVVDIGPDPITGKRRRRWHTFKGPKKEAQKELTKLLNDLNQNTYVEPQRMTVADCLDKWLGTVKHNISPRTYEGYDAIVKNRLSPLLGHHRLAKLHPSHIQALYTGQLESGRRDGKGGLSARSVKHIHRVLAEAMKWAVRQQLRATNPCDAVDTPRPARTEMKTLTHAESAKVLRAAEGRALYMPVLLALTTGMRRGEILALQWRDVDIAAATVCVRQSLEHTKSGGLRIKATKTARGQRTIDLPSVAVDALKRHQLRQKEERLRLGPAFTDHDLVCCKPDGELVTPGSLSAAFADFIAAQKLHVRFHDLRHTHISHLLAAGVHPKVASERAGHASIAITMDTYSHVLPGIQKDAASRIDLALRQAIENGE